MKLKKGVDINIDLRDGTLTISIDDNVVDETQVGTNVPFILGAIVGVLQREGVMA